MSGFSPGVARLGRVEDYGPFRNSGGEGLQGGAALPGVGVEGAAGLEEEGADPGGRSGEQQGD